MRIDGITLREGSQINNLTVASGSAFPGNANTGELYFLTSVNPAVEGMYLYFEAQWVRISSEFNLIVPHGNTLPVTGVDSQLFFKSTAIPNDTAEGLYYWDTTGTAQWRQIGGTAFTVTGDATGTYDNAGGLPLTLSTVNPGPGSYGSASTVPVLAINGKGLTTSSSSIAISIDAAGVSSGTFANGRVSQSSVTQHQAALTILESQITDSAIFPRLASAETVSGIWNFTSLPTSSVTPTGSTQLVNKAYADSLSAPLGGGSNKVFYENDATVTANYTITTGKNAMTAGPVLISSGVTVTVPSGSVWTVV